MVIRTCTSVITYAIKNADFEYRLAIEDDLDYTKWLDVTFCY